jgi:hypothetical protein
VANVKVSALDELATGPSLSADFLLINDGGTSKKILPQYMAGQPRGALVGLSADITTVNITGTYYVPWEATVWDTESDLGLNKVWLGVNQTFTAATSDIVTSTSHGMITADGPFQFTTSGTLPAGLSTATDYWCILIDANTFYVASSLANAIAGTRIDITDTGSGTHTIDREQRLTIPNGWSYARITTSLYITSHTSNQFVFAYVYDKTGSVNFPGAGTSVFEVNQTHVAGTSFTGVLSLSAGDWFRIRAQAESDTSVQIESNLSWALVELFN